MRIHADPDPQPWFLKQDLTYAHWIKLFNIFDITAQKGPMDWHQFLRTQVNFNGTAMSMRYFHESIQIHYLATYRWCPPWGIWPRTADCRVSVSAPRCRRRNSWLRSRSVSAFRTAKTTSNTKSKTSWSTFIFIKNYILITRPGKPVLSGITHYLNFKIPGSFQV